MKQKLVIAALLMPFVAVANEQFLIDYFRSFDTFEADFKQTIKNKKQKEESTGHLAIQKRALHQLDPKFAFDYQKPFPQQLISNGKVFWDYDADLMQVVIRPMSEIENNALLTTLLSEESLADHFTIKTRTNQRHYELTPKVRGDGLEVTKLTVRFNNGVLNSFTAHENSGQEVELQLSNVRQNPIFDSKIFEFKVPKGVDVIDESRR